MKELSIEDKAKRYEKLSKEVKDFFDGKQKMYSDVTQTLEHLFPELKENEDERIRETLIGLFSNNGKKEWKNIPTEKIIAWLEKQGGDTNETINRDEFVQGILRRVAINLITWIDYNAAEGNMCLSNMECEDIEDALVSGDWDKIYAYMKKKLEKQDEQKPAWSEEDETTRNALINLVEMYYGGCINQSEKNRLLDWLKSLNPQDHCVDDKQQTGVTAWIARDRDGGVLLYYSKPVKLTEIPIWNGPIRIKELPEGIDPRWEDEEPIEVELIIKKKTNEKNY